MDYKDYYQTLGVASNASAEDITKAYRKLMRKHHPDLNQATDAGDKTKEINQAYAVLGDPARRAAYDGDDFFADLFAGPARRARQGGAFRMRGEDIHASLAIGLADAYSGATRNVTLRMPRHDAGGRVVQRERCVELAIPRGVLPGQQLRVAGQGHAGSGGGPPGDLFLEIHFTDDARYRVEQRNVFEKLALAPWEAALGASIDVPTPSGRVQVAVPAGSQSGRKLRLKGRGIPGHPAGDLFLVLEVVLPPASSAKARELYQAMARDLAFNPRGGMRA